MSKDVEEKGVGVDPDKTVRLARSRIIAARHESKQDEIDPVMRFRNLRFVRTGPLERRRGLFARKKPVLSPPISQRSWWVKNPWQPHATLAETLLSVVFLFIVVVGAVVAWYSLARHTTSSQAHSVSSTTPSGIFSGPTTPSLVTAPAGSPALAAYQWLQQGTKQTVYIDTQHHLQYISSGDGNNWLQIDLTLRAHAPVAAGQAISGYIATATNTQEIAYVSVRQHIELLQITDNGQATVQDLTSLLQAPLANATVISGFDWPQTGQQQIVYIDLHSHVIELTGSNSNWHKQDLTARTGSALADGATLTGFIWGVDNSQHIAYVDRRQHIVELRGTAHASWRRQDLTQTLGIPLASTSNLIGYQWVTTGEKIIDYVDQQHDIEELTSTQQSGWTLSNITQQSHQSPLGGTALTAFTWPQGNQRLIAFIDTNNHIQELSLLPFSQWTAKDLSVSVSPPVPSDAVIVGFAWVQADTQQLLYFDVQQQPQELSEKFGGGWHLADWRSK